MDTDFYGPPLPPKSFQNVQSERASKQSDLESDYSEHPKKVVPKAKRLPSKGSKTKSKRMPTPKELPDACLSKSLAHILQRELYTMGNTGLLRREAEMILLQPHLGDSKHQELSNSPFWPTLFLSPTLRVLDPIKTSPFVVPTTRKEAPTGNAPMGQFPSGKQ